MEFVLECPECKKPFQVNHEDLATKASAVKCCFCGNTPTPDIATAYANVGKTMIELYGCCQCKSKNGWLPKELK